MMTNEEAVDAMQSQLFFCHSKGEFDATNLAIGALKKQVPMKWIKKGYRKCCPICSRMVSKFYCKHCGQLIDWSEE